MQGFHAKQHGSPTILEQPFGFDIIFVQQARLETRIGKAHAGNAAGIKARDDYVVPHSSVTNALDDLEFTSVGF